MGKIWLTSDFHFCHDQEFVWKARGFESVEEMNQAIVDRFKSKIQPEDTLYILGDCMLNDNEKAEGYLAQIPGKKIFIRGNHDTNPRVAIYQKYTDEEVKWADMIKYKKKNIYLSHHPTIVTNAGEVHNLVINFYGHTHQTEDFYKDYVNMYHVGVDSHNCYPVLIDDALAAVKEKISEGINFE
jgi:calcineurin-like phosphoesterase family protein